MPELNELSEREREILHLVATGASNKEIASELYISTNTVKVHLRNIFAKIGVTSRTEAAMYAVSTGLVEPVAAVGENRFSVLAGEGESPASLDAESPSKGGLLQVFGQNPWLVVLLSAFLIGLGISGAYLINRSQSGLTLASNGAAAATPPPRWREKAGLPTARSGLALAAYENRIYAIGGETGAEITGVLERYDPSRDSWMMLSAKPTAVTDIAAAVIGGLLYVPGGRLADGQPTDILEVYDPRRDRWEQRASLPKAVSAYALVPFEGKIYLFGGWDGERYIADVLEYNPDGDAWYERSRMPTARGHAGAAMAGGKIYIIGGFDGEKALAVNDEYLPEGDTQSGSPWRERAPLPAGRYAMGVASVAEIVHVFGGSGEGSDFPALEYIPGNDDWLEIETPPKQLGSHLEAVLLGSHIYVLGGKVADQPVANNAEYQAIYTLSIPVAP
jgi:DNA-binding CsgD family transcriptional regulator/N-acetylneuraminic acid mutarotase